MLTHTTDPEAPLTLKTKHCYRCEKLGRKADKPLAEFYKDPNGKPLPGCIQCRKELSKLYYRRDKQALKRVQSGRIVSPFASLSAPRTLVVVEAPDVPPIAVWRCMSCWTKATTKATDKSNPPFPHAWRKLSPLLGGKERLVNLCGPCSALLIKARRMLERIHDRIKATEAGHEATVQ